MKNNIVICIGRQFGSAGKEIGELVAKKLGIPCYDKEIINEMAKKSGVSKELLENFDERPTNSILYSLSLGSYSTPNNIISNMSDLPLTDKIFLIQSDTIKSLAQTSCVFIGRCAESILSEYKAVLSVFIHADFDKRVERVIEKQHIKKEDAASLIKKMDKKRSSYHNYFCDTRWGDASSYDLCINSNCNVEYAADLIISAINLK